MKRITTLLLILAVSITTASAQSPNASPSTLNPVWQETFQVVWQTVKDKHYDPQFGGVDWDQVHTRYAAKVAAVKSESELYRALREMLGELRQSHFSIYAPEAAPVGEAPRGGPVGEIGVNISLLQNQALITRVVAGTPAARAGLKPGYLIKQIDETKIETLLERTGKNAASTSIAEVYQIREIENRLDGRAGTAVKIIYLDEKNAERSAMVDRELWRGEYSPAFGNMPPQRLEFEAKRLEGGVGYLAFNIFMPTMMEKIRTAIRSFADAPGIIIDLRGNPGGVGAMSSGIAGLISRTEGSLGRMQMRAGYMNFAIHPQQTPYLGPVAIIIDRQSASTSEVLAGGLQDIGRAVIVGERSAGAALPSIFTKLPTGAIFQYAVADFKTTKGTLLEGRGVTPDIEAKPERESLLAGRDNQIEAALAALRKQSGGNKQN